MHNKKKEEIYLSNSDSSCLFIIKHLCNKNKAVEQLKRLYNKTTTNILSNYFNMTDEETVKYLDDFYYEILPEIKVFNENIELQFFVEFLLIKKIISEISLNNFFQNCIKSDIAKLYITENSKENSLITKIFFNLLGKSKVNYVSDKYYYIQNENYLKKKYGGNKIWRYNKFFKIIFGPKSDIKITNWIKDNQNYLHNIVNVKVIKPESKLKKLLKKVGKLNYWEQKIVVCCVFLILLGIFSIFILPFLF